MRAVSPSFDRTLLKNFSNTLFITDDDVGIGFAY